MPAHTDPKIPKGAKGASAVPPETPDAQSARSLSWTSKSGVRSSSRLATTSPKTHASPAPGGASSHKSSGGSGGAPWCACSQLSAGVGAPSHESSSGSGGAPLCACYRRGDGVGASWRGRVEPRRPVMCVCFELSGGVGAPSHESSIGSSALLTSPFFSPSSLSRVVPPEQRRQRVEPRERRWQRRRPVVPVLLAER